jgi:diamine N-acetyltransferase
MANAEGAPGREAAVSLREITFETLRPVLALEVRQEQAHLVASNAVSIAEAHFAPFAWLRAIYADETPVGFLMLHDEHLLEEPRQQGFYFLWRFMVDGRYQGNGYGARAMALLIEHVRSRPHAREFVLSHLDADGNAGDFFRGLGFEYTGERHGPDLGLRLSL